MQETNEPALNHILKDITLVDKGYILHVTNTLNKMGKGVAKELYERYPHIKTEYHDYLKYYSFKKTVPIVVLLILVLVIKTIQN